MSAVSYYTPEGLKKLRDELNHLKDVERPMASQAIAEARDKGDLSENAEYDAAKEAQGLLELKISNFNTPFGTLTSAISPTLVPKRPLPIGEFTDIFPDLRSASLSATNV